jgi:hypothetical protein
MDITENSFIFQYAFPKFLSSDLQVVLNTIPHQTDSNVDIMVSRDAIEYRLSTEKISFPYRLYCVEVSESEQRKFSYLQEMILHCIYSRSCDGFVRERHVNQLLLMEYEEWAFPYIVKVCDEYIVEILEMVYESLSAKDNSKLKAFCLVNRKSFYKSYNRMISYWNEFYRDKCYRYKDYIGKKLFMDCFGFSRPMIRQLSRRIDGE